MSRSGSVPDKSTQEAARQLARVIIIGVPLMLLGQLIFVPPERVVLAIGLTVIGGAMALATLLVVTAGGPWRLLVAPVIALLDLTAILCGALLPMGVDVAVILPFIGAVVLVAAFDRWQLRGGLLLAWLSGIAGSWLARSSPGVLAIPHMAPVPWAVAMVAAGTAIGYAILGWAAGHWHATIAEKDASMNAVRVAQVAQQRAAERLRALVDNSPLPTFAIDAAGVINAWNPAAEGALGWTAGEAVGKRVEEIVPAGSRKGVLNRIERAMDGHLAGPRITRFLRKDGTEARAEVYDGLERDADGRPVGVVVQFLDMTEREAMAARLVEAQRLEAVGQLAGGVAHDFNNSLTAIAGFASLIATGESPNAAEDARTIVSAADHAATLIRQLLAFSRRVPLLPQMVDLRDFVASVQPLVRSLVGETIQIQLETEPQAALVEVDPPSLEQAVLNLVANARDAMPRGGDLTLAVRSFPDCLADDASEPEQHVALCVSDTGPGIAPDVVGRVFEPFFTTKPPGKGTGLGLAMVHGFAAQSHGHVRVSSRPGQGATFELHFPRAAGTVAQPRPRSEPVGGSDSILFVEDDEGVASFGLACLRRLGYDVTPAMNGVEAAMLATNRSEPFDLLLTDVVIPGMSGPELAALIRRQHPSTAVLYASGYSAEQVSADVRGAGVPLLEKPYSLPQLAAQVREVLDGRAAAPDRAAGPKVKPDGAKPAVR
jgi:two-component system cell cycle sensor histidine kinase/response regulator CckA